MPLTFRSRLADRLPVSLAGLTPAALAAKTIGEIEKTLIWQGNRQVPLAELFAVAGDPADLVWRLEGDFSAVHYVAAGMEQGEVQVAGDVGRHAGQGMRGGTLTITGSAGDWLGCEMRGGQIEVAGNAGDHAGGVLPGSKVGMRGGQMLIRGSCGTHAAAAMRRGWLTVVGDCGEWAGYRMRAGTLMVLGECGPRPGASMRRGTIALLGGSPPLLPTFRYACDFEPQALALMLGPLQQQGIEVDRNPRVALYNGDLLEGGRGEVLVAS